MGRRAAVDFIDFYNDDEPHQIPKDDPDLEILGQGLLRLPPSMPKPQRAPVHSSDVLTVSRFVDAFKAELKLPKGTLSDFQVCSTLNLLAFADLFFCILRLPCRRMRMWICDSPGKSCDMPRGSYRRAWKAQPIQSS